MFALSVTLLVLATLLALVQSTRKVEYPGSVNGWDEASMEKMVWATNVMELPNDTYVYFYFTNTGAWATPQFQTTLTTFSHLDLYWWDLYCAGDQMNLYATLNIGGDLFNLSTPGRVPVGEASCENYTLDPATADANLAFSTGGFHTGGGFVANYTLVPILSPFSAGKGVLKAIYTA